MAEIEVPQPEEIIEKSEKPFTRMVALAVTVYAVVLALAAAGGNNAGKDMLMGQMQATNTWARYQAKVQREVLYVQEREQLESDLSGKADAMPADLRARKEKRLAFIKSKLAEYEKEKVEISTEARGHEQERDQAIKKDPYFDLAEMALQISIILASVAMLADKKWAFYASLVLAIIGAVMTTNGYFLLDAGKLLGATHSGGAG